MTNNGEADSVVFGQSHRAPGRLTHKRQKATKSCLRTSSDGGGDKDLNDVDKPPSSY